MSLSLSLSLQLLLLLQTAVIAAATATTAVTATTSGGATTTLTPEEEDKRRVKLRLKEIVDAIPTNQTGAPYHATISCHNIKTQDNMSIRPAITCTLAINTRAR